MVIDLAPDHPSRDSEHFCIRDGILVVMKRGIIPSGAKLVGILD